MSQATAYPSQPSPRSRPPLSPQALHGRRHRAGRRRMGRRHTGVQHDRGATAGARRRPRGHDGRDRGRRVRRDERHAGRGQRAATTPRRSAPWTRSSSSRPTRFRESRSTPSDGSPASPPARNGPTSSPGLRPGSRGAARIDPHVSVAGYSLGGGVGWYARKLGLSTNSVTALEVVTADGQLRRVDADHGADLFWALRGGGGSFGIVPRSRSSSTRSRTSTRASCSSLGALVGGAPRVARVDGHRAGRGHLGGADPAVPAARGYARAGPRRPVRRRRGRLHGR